MKRIVICCDGTWNSSDKENSLTNVRKLWEFVRPHDGQGHRQMPLYFPGLGVSALERLQGGLGWGLSQNVREAYHECVARFDPGDELFLFGFSRGAYTARSVAGLIRNSGMLKRAHLDQLDAAYELYRRRGERTGPRTAPAIEFRKKFSHETRIKLIGVWDTVGSLGIPTIAMGLANVLFRGRWSFHDVELSTWVDFAYQALAIDERRGPFRPTIWKQRPDAVNQTLEQVWFAGVHSDIGGGYPETGLSDLALLWMLDKAASCGLAFDWDLITQHVHPDPLGTMHDSLTIFYRVLERVAPLVRIQLGQTRRRDIGDRKDSHESVASAVILRQAGMQPPYGPANVKRYLAGGGKITSVRIAP